MRSCMASSRRSLGSGPLKSARAPAPSVYASSAASLTAWTALTRSGGSKEFTFNFRVRSIGCAPYPTVSRFFSRIRNRLAGLRIVDRSDLDRGEELILGDAADGFHDRALPREGLWIRHEMDNTHPHVFLEVFTHRRPAFLGLNGSDDSIPA